MKQCPNEFTGDRGPSFHGSSEVDAELRHDLGYGALSVTETVSLIEKSAAEQGQAEPGWTPEQYRLDGDVEHLPYVNLDFALPLIRSLAVRAEPFCRELAAGSMKGLGEEYLKRHGHIQGLVSLWIGLISEPNRIGECAYDRLEEFLDTYVVDDAVRGAIIDLTDVMRLRLQDPNWRDNPYPTAP
jgi:hypothetical protein